MACGSLVLRLPRQPLGAARLLLCVALAVCLRCGGAKARATARAAARDGDRLVLDPMKHEVGIVTPTTFDTKISKHRDGHVHAVLFYTHTDECKKFVDEVYDVLAKDLKGIANIQALDCADNENYCKKLHSVTAFPTVVIYPELPRNSVMIKEAMTVKTLKSQIYSYVPSRVRMLTKAQVDGFLASNVVLPKAILFGVKAKPSVMYKALSNEFKDKLELGFIDAKAEDVSALLKRFHVKPPPPGRLVVTQYGKPNRTYDGPMEFRAIFSWLNNFAETFAKGGGFEHKGGAANVEEQTWKFEAIPEMTKNSHQDICFRDTTKGLCAIFLRSGSPISEEEKGMLMAVKESNRSHLDGRGVSFRFMWMDVEQEPAFKELFAPDRLPNFVIFNAHKRLRFTKLESEVVGHHEHQRATSQKTRKKI
eukprot:GHVT01047909.1.p1 GENE.GHVT01047909.1~~GHVT01047909.1.p1  ORF type:complete len:421 (-),score=100.09 GHVT01047909.1:552-1814(-)